MTFSQKTTLADLVIHCLAFNIFKVASKVTNAAWEAAFLSPSWKPVVIIPSSFSAGSVLLAELSDKMDICFLRTLGDGGLCLRGRTVRRKRCHLSLTACVCSSVSFEALSNPPLPTVYLFSSPNRDVVPVAHRERCVILCAEKKRLHTKVGGKKNRRRD